MQSSGRAKLHKELQLIKRKGNYYVTDILDFIIADRKRVVAPLIKLKNGYNLPEITLAIFETLKNAGIE